MLTLFDICEDNGLSTLEDTTPLNTGIVLVANDDDLPMGYAALAECFIGKQLILDLETQCPENQAYALSPYEGDIRLMQLAAMGQKTVLVIDFKTPAQRSQQSPAYLAFLNAVIEKLREFAAAKGIPIGHNIGFDLSFLRVKYGIHFWHAYDTQILSQILYAGILTYRHSLKACVERELGIPVDKTEQMSDWSKPLTNSQINYAASDISVTKLLFTALAKKVKDAGLGMVAKIEAEFLPALVDINYWGLPVDVVELEKQIAWYQKQLLALEIEFLDIVGYSKIRSPKHIANLVEKLEAVAANNQDDEDGDEYEEETEEATVKKIEVLKASGKATKADLAMLQDHRVIQVVSIYRTLAIYHKYCEKVKQEMREVQGVMRVSGFIRQLTRKANGRTSAGGNSRAPRGLRGINTQNANSRIPKHVKALGCPRVRDIFKAPDNHLFVNVDLPAAHLALAIFYAQEDSLTKVAEAGLDLHAVTMFNVFKKVDDYKEYRKYTVAEITHINDEEAGHTGEMLKLHLLFKAIRAWCKNVIYSGLNFGGEFTLQTTIKSGSGKEVPIEICKVMTESFEYVVPKIAKLRDRIWQKMNEKIVKIDGHYYGLMNTNYCVATTPNFNRLAYSFCKFNKHGKPYVPKGDIALTWLASEGTLMREGIANIYQELVLTRGIDFRLGLICHDEVMGYAPDDKAAECAEVVKQSMLAAMRKFTGNGFVPLPAMEKDSSKLISKMWNH